MSLRVRQIDRREWLLAQTATECQRHGKGSDAGISDATGNVGSVERCRKTVVGVDSTWGLA